MNAIDMGNLFDYVKQYGPLTFDRHPFNEVDNLVFAELSYLDFKGLVNHDIGFGHQTLKSIYRPLLEQNTLRFSGIMDTSYRKLPPLLTAVAQSPRYADTVLTGYVNYVEEQRAKQFAAIVFTFQPNVHYIAFRGTDSTFIGWKEDFYLSFTNNIPSQINATAYLFKAAINLEGSFFIGGHSKGGTLSVYAASHVREPVRVRIRGIYNNDGPGLKAHEIAKESYQELLNRIHTFLPKESVIGILFEKGETISVVDSTQMGMMQHDAFSWMIEGDRFVRLPDLSNTAKAFHHDIKAWLDDLTEEQRAKFFDLAFKVLETSGAKTLRELSLKAPFSTISMIVGYSKLRPKEKESLRVPIRKFFSGNDLMRKINLLYRIYPRIIKDKKLK